MSKQIVLKGKIQQITRKAGKSEAVMQITIPAHRSNEIPLVEVNITLEEAQQSLLPKTKVTIKKIRGDKG